MIGVGLMSGTSADSVDAACVQLSGQPPRLNWQLLSFVTLPMQPELRQRVFRAFRPETGTVDLLCQLNFELGEVFAQATAQAAKEAGLSLSQLDFVGSHGQTVWHVPPQAGGTPSTLQLGSPAVIAQRTGCRVVSDFRSRDMAAGGQGAPLVPFVDALLLTHPEKSRAVQNIGGIGNVTYLPAGAAGDAFGFDTGPGNMLLDRAAERLSGGTLRCDLDGGMALAGTVCHPLLDGWMRDPYFAVSPPKSTGRELFGVQRCDDYLAQAAERGLSVPDTMATLTALTAGSIADAYRRFLPALPQQVLLCGGGARNPAIRQMLQSQLPDSTVLDTDDAGLPGDAKEAVAFAVLAYETLHRRPGNLPAATGARQTVILGSITD